MTKEDIFNLAKKAQELCERYKVPFFINDDLDLVVLMMVLALMTQMH